MKHTILPLILLFLISCQETKKTEEAPVAPPPAEEEAPAKTLEPTASFQDKDVLGSYVGSFDAKLYNPNKKPSYSNRINISLNRLENDKVFGHSVVAGNIRPFEGTYLKNENGVYEMKVKEPGDDRYDGTFTFKIQLTDPKPMQGEWVANDQNLAVSVRGFSLAKKNYAYDPNVKLPEEVTMDGLYDTWAEDDRSAESLTDDVLKFNASKTVLKKEDVENMYKADLEFIRNAVYARHGYSFKNRRVRYVFDQYVDWYIPVSTDIRDQLTDIERQNIDLLKRYEEHADAYYDEFGR